MLNTTSTFNPSDANFDFKDISYCVALKRTAYLRWKRFAKAQIKQALAKTPNTHHDTILPERCYKLPNGGLEVWMEVNGERISMLVEADEFNYRYE